MNTRTRIVLIIMMLVILLATSACGTSATITAPEGKFSCSISIPLQGTADLVALNFTITPDQKIESWSIFDLGTRRMILGDAVGQSSLTGNTVTFALTDSSSTITYKINGMIESTHKMTGDYTIDYGSPYGVVADKFECNLISPTPTP